jgi:hypothetical protein
MGSRYYLLMLPSLMVAGFNVPAKKSVVPAALNWEIPFINIVVSF